MTTQHEALRAAREVHKTSLTVLCALHKSDALTTDCNMLLDIKIAIDGNRAAIKQIDAALAAPTETDQFSQALAEVLPFIVDANNTKAPAVVAWHRKHTAAIEAAAEAHGRAHLLVKTEPQQPPSPDQHARASQGGDATAAPTIVASAFHTKRPTGCARGERCSGHTILFVGGAEADTCGLAGCRHNHNSVHGGCGVDRVFEAIGEDVPGDLTPRDPLLHLEPCQITRLPGGLHIACIGEAQLDAIVAALGGV